MCSGVLCHNEFEIGFSLSEEKPISVRTDITKLISADNIGLFPGSLSHYSHNKLS